MKITVIYNKNYSDKDFPSKFTGDKEIEIIRLKNPEYLKELENWEKLNSYISVNIKPLDIVKVLWELPKGQKRSKQKRYWGHAFVYLGWDSQCQKHKVCHAYSDQNDNSVIKISSWENNFWDKFLEGKKEKMMIIHRPKDVFKKSDIIVEHIAKCIEGKNEYFDKFGKIKIKTEKNDKANNCEHFVNRCVLGLDFSELVDIESGELKREFNLEQELGKNNSRLFVLCEQISCEIINEISNYVSKNKVQCQTMSNGYKN